jgi:hypothetical protein
LAATVPNSAGATDLLTSGNTLSGGFTTVYSSLSGDPVKILWSGKKFYYLRSDGRVLHSSNGIAPWTNTNILNGQVADITFTPPNIALTPSDAFERYFMTSSIRISGSLNANEWVQFKNITSLPQDLWATESSRVWFPAQTIDTPTAIVYSDGSSLTAV